MAVVDAVRSRHGVEEIHRFRAELRGVGEIALLAQLPLDARDGRGPRGLLGLDAVAPQQETRGIYLRAGRRDPKLHGLEVAHAHSGVARAARFHRFTGKLEGRLGVAYRRADQAMRDHRGDGHAIERVRIRPRAWKVRAA